ncbi:sensor domain-containing diguanylate cyclase [Azonexus sp.]|uniref:sensor domain-containing diguanylate cyclase n=1 Tax=Azonexus sp. TaxID=1872668 RepID=UPI0027BA9EF4|nr:sensor domain-containing diguanylate cyclase [Azonexus sp.]
MSRPFQIANRRSMILLLSLLLSGGFFATTLFGYFVSKEAIRSAIIGQDLPLTSSNIYSEIQRDLVRPVLISSTMAHDTFLRDWVLKGENEVTEMARYLAEVKIRNKAFSSFFVSEKSGNYYTGEGVLKQVKEGEARDDWYFRVRDMQEDYEINVDPDLANRDALTIFINYRVFDFDGQYIGATGIGLTVDSVRHLIREYQTRFKRTIYFTDANGKVVVFGSQAETQPDLRTRPGLAAQLDQILKERSGLYQFEDKGDNHILNVKYLPELKWHLFVEQNEDVALAGIRQTLYVNLAISLLVTLIVTFLSYLTLGHYQSRIEKMASTDKLTGLLNRHAFAILIDKLLANYRRKPQPITFLLSDIDHFKRINDQYGHRTGDLVLANLAELLRSTLRAADFAIRWGGEEFLLVLPGCTGEEGLAIAEKLRQEIEAATPSAEHPEIRTSMSFGVSQFNGSESPEQAISRADKALYAVKENGRNGVRLAADETPARNPA